MYSRYSNFSIPKNYSGSRFSSPIETSTKTHRANNSGAIKSSHSPSFTAKQDEPINEELYEEQLDSIDTNDDDNSNLEEASLQESLDEKSSNESCEYPKSLERGGFNFSSFKSLFDGIAGDELIILGLIFLLINDGEKDNNDIITILVFLLLSGKI